MASRAIASHEFWSGLPIRSSPDFGVIRRRLPTPSVTNARCRPKRCTQLFVIVRDRRCSEQRGQPEYRPLDINGSPLLWHRLRALQHHRLRLEPPLRRRTLCHRPVTAQSLIYPLFGEKRFRTGLVSKFPWRGSPRSPNLRECRKSGAPDSGRVTSYPETRELLRRCRVAANRRLSRLHSVHFSP